MEAAALRAPHPRWEGPEQTRGARAGSGGRGEGREGGARAGPDGDVILRRGQLGVEGGARRGWGPAAAPAGPGQGLRDE